MSDASSDDVWEVSRVDGAPSEATVSPRTKPTISSLPRSLVELQQLRTARKTITNIVAWLRDRHDPHASPELQELVAIYGNWMAQSAAPLSDPLWFELAEMGVWLAIYTANATPCVQFKTTACRPTTMPTKDAFCDRQRATQFTCQLFDALCGPLAAAATTVQGKAEEEDAVAAIVVDVFFHWMGQAMKSYEFIFLNHAAQPLVHHIQQKSTGFLGPIQSAVEAYVAKRLHNWQQHAPSIAVACLLLSASTHTSALRSIHEIVVSKPDLIASFPHIHEPISILAVALLVAPLAVAPSPMLHQFLTLRVVSLALLSPRLMIQEQHYHTLLSRYQETLARMATQENADVDACLKMMDACTHEITSTMATNPEIHTCVLLAMQAHSEEPLFRKTSKEAAALLRGASHGDDDEEQKASQRRPMDFPAEQFLSKIYETVSTGLRALLALSSSSSSRMLDCFAALVRLEFARESCAQSPQRNQLIVQLTHQIEELIDKAPDATLSFLASKIFQYSTEKQNQDAVAFGWTALCIGLLMQRKLRVVLFHTQEQTKRDVFAVVFTGLYHPLVPFHGFAQRFLGFTLSSLSTFVAIEEIFPFYLQETLRKFPEEATNEEAASVLGTIFGALYYTSSYSGAEVTVVVDQDKETQTRHAMILWALRCCRVRAEVLLLGGHSGARGAPLPAVVEEGSIPPPAHGLYLAELFLEIAKMAPVELLPKIAQEVESLVASSYTQNQNQLLCEQVKTRVFNAISLNCEAEKRAWLAAWFLEICEKYPTANAISTSTSSSATGSNSGGDRELPAARL